MEWLKSLFVEHSALQAVVVISLISTIGIGLGKIRFFGISLGVAGVILASVFIRQVFVPPAHMPVPYAEHRKNVFRS